MKFGNNRTPLLYRNSILTQSTHTATTYPVGQSSCPGWKYPHCSAGRWALIRSLSGKIGDHLLPWFALLPHTLSVYQHSSPYVETLFNLVLTKLPFNFVPLALSLIKTRAVYTFLVPCFVWTAPAGSFFSVCDGYRQRDTVEATTSLQRVIDGLTACCWVRGTVNAFLSRSPGSVEAFVASVPLSSSVGQAKSHSQP